MRPTYYLTVFAAFVLFFTCCKKESDHWGEFSVLKNGTPWEGKIRAEPTTFSSAKATVFIQSFDKDGLVIETLVFFKVPTKVSKLSLSETINHPPDDSFIGCNYLNSYEDQLLDIFVISANDSTSYIEITDYNEEKGELRGKFNLILWPEPGIPGSWNAPDSLVFSDGVFHTRIN